MSKQTDEFEKALEGKKIPILTLDNNWHRLFTQTEPNQRIKELEEELNNLLKEQGMAKDSERLVEWLQSSQNNQDDRTKMYSQCILRMDTIENAIKAEPETISRYNEAVSDIRKNGKGVYRRVKTLFPAFSTKRNNKFTRSCFHC